MIEEKHFLQAIMQSPADDVPRLQYADWLEEMGDPKGEFIRLQVELATNRSNDPRRDRLRARQDVLWNDNGTKWQEEWERTLRPLGVTVVGEWVRGFPEKVTIAAGAFVTHAEGLFQAAPIRNVDLRGLDPNYFNTPAEMFALARRVFSCPQLSNVTSLDLSSQNAIGTEGARALASSPHVANLRSLNLSDNDLGDAAAQSLACSPHLGGLRDLNLGGNVIAIAGIRALAESPHITRLGSLALAGNGLNHDGIGPEGARVLAASQALSSLTTLWLGTNGIGSAGTAALASPASRLSNLRELDLAFNDIGNTGVAALAGAECLSKLTSLTLTGNGISNTGVAALVSPTSRVSNLRELRLDLNEVGNAGVVAFAKSSCIRNLTQLNLRMNHIGATGARALATSSHLGQLATLDLYGNRLGDIGAGAIARNTGLDPKQACSAAFVAA